MIIEKTENGIYKMLDLSEVPKKKYGGRVVNSWQECKSSTIIYTEDSDKYLFTVTFKSRDKHGQNILNATYNKKEVEIRASSITSMKLGKVIKNHGLHSYKVGSYKNRCKVLKQIRITNKSNGHKEKGYLMYCPEARDTFRVTESNLKQGKGSPYIAGKKFLKKNTFLSRSDLLPYIVKEEDKRKNLYSNKKILTQCDNCKHKQLKYCQTLAKYGFNCSICSKGISYPERFVGNYLKAFNIIFETQKRFQELQNRRFDFYLPEHNIVIETHGMQHYSSSFNFGSNKKEKELNFKEQQRVDSIKKSYCEKNNLKIVEIDCRISDPSHIAKSINRISELPKITKNIEKEIAEQSTRKEIYNIEEMKTMFKNGETTYHISRKYGLSQSSVHRILTRAGFDMSPIKKIVNLNERIVFRQVAQAANYYRVPSLSSNLPKHTRGERKYCGQHPTTGEPLKWMYYEDYVEKYGAEGLTEYVEDKRELL